MKQVYFDQASTSSPKVDGLGEVIAEYIASGGYNISRGQYAGAMQVARHVIDVRKDIARYFHFPHFRNVIFTGNITHSINLALKGFLQPGEEVLTSSMEHNAVMRPLAQLEKQGIRVKIVPTNKYGELDPAAMERAVGPKTRAIILTAASNVCGTTMAIRDVGDVAQRHELIYIIDSAQVAGHFPLDVSAFHCDAFCFTGHKGLKGPQGIGGVLLAPEFAEILDPLISGGTGSNSDSAEMPAQLPDHFEAGTPNLPGIIGLGHAVQALLDAEPYTAYLHEMELCRAFLEGIQTRFSPQTVQNKGLGVEACEQSIRCVEEAQAAGLPAISNLPSRMPLLSLDFPQEDNATVSFRLENDYHIMTRCALHCAPNAHRSLGTFPEGTVRFSFGPRNTLAEVDYVLNALEEILP